MQLQTAYVKQLSTMFDVAAFVCYTIKCDVDPWTINRRRV